MPGKAVGRAAVDLPWLCPNADSLIALAERPTTLADVSHWDHALLAFLLRHGCAEHAEPQTSLSNARLLSAALPDVAVAYLERGAGAWRNASHPFVATVNELAQQSSELAGELARLTCRAAPQEAAWAAQMASLGWLAVTTVNPDAAAKCRGDGRFASDPLAIQREHWSLDHEAIARRLATRWRLPQRIASVVGQLSLPLSSARPLVPDANLFSIVYLAAREAERRLGSFGLTATRDAEEHLHHLDLRQSQIEALVIETRTNAAVPADPRFVPLLPNLLRMAGEARRRNGSTLVLRLEEKVDSLQSALDSMATESTDRIHEARLRGLAELAAGAGHEINNPLMVIAGHAQRLRQKETDPDREGVLRTIERQCERIASLIKGLMQFARPARPHAQRWPAAELLQAVREDLLVEADLRGISLSAERSATEAWIDADREQIRQALRAVVRNGIEAVEEGGWVRVSANVSDSQVSFLVEDSGPGVPVSQRELMFDPFFCGRPAGRGRGLGLSIAWRLAAQNGGELRYEGRPGGITQFRLTLPRVGDQIERLSA